MTDPAKHSAQRIETPPPTAFDWTEWLSHLDEIDVSDAEKRQLIETLWQIVTAFVDLGWQAGGLPTTAAENGGQNTDLSTLVAGIMLQSDYSIQNKKEEV